MIGKEIVVLKRLELPLVQIERLQSTLIRNRLTWAVGNGSIKRTSKNGYIERLFRMREAFNMR